MKEKERGFTLIELLVVVGIIGILTGLVTFNLQGARERARDAQRKGDLDQLQKALELYKNDQSPQAYPAMGTWGTDITTGSYMKEVPEDPTHRQVDTWPDYTYTADIVSEPLEYTLVACFENAADPSVDAVNTCGTGFSYTLMQP